MERKLLAVLVLSLLTISLVQTGFIYLNSVKLTTGSQVTGKATTQEGLVSLCLNNPPFINYSCSTNLTQNVFFSCALNVSDADNDTLTYAVQGVSGYFGGAIDTNGIYSVTPTQNMTGNTTVRFTASDNALCGGGSNSSIEVNFSVSDINEAPVYDVSIGSITFAQDTTYRGLFLEDHFTDPDGDAMTFTYFSFSSDLSFTIIGGTSEVIISHASCGTGSVIFQATDPLNLSGSSEVISIEVPCEDDDDSSSGGGGGGGASSSSCETQWQCLSWDRCLFNNSQRKLCTDVNGCQDPYQVYFWQNCTYIAHCFNGVLDLDEQGVDCGGDDCEECQTCDDGKLNNYEVEVDCGGPNCPACASCTDGVQNYQETGIDCGGPICGPCPSCEDGIQNQNETGIDCGGPFCGPCTRIETPSVIDEVDDSSRLNVILLASFIAVGLLALGYRLFRKQILAFIAALLLASALKRKKQILFTAEQKHFLFSRLHEIEAKKLLEANKLTQFQDLLSRLQRQFFSFLMDTAADTQLIDERINKLQTIKVVKELLKKQYRVVLRLETQKDLSKLDLLLQLEYFRTIIFTLCSTKREDIARDIEQLSSYKKPEVDVIKQALYNGILALQFKKVKASRAKYMEALKLYEQLEPALQAKVYDDLMLEFQNLAYASTFMK